MKKLLLIPLLAAGLAVTGCSTNTVREPTYQEARNNEFIPANRAAASKLVAQLEGRIASPGTLIIASLANVDALDESSTFGRIVAEQISAEFTQNGYHMRELKLRNTVGITEEGELMLSRDVQRLAREYDAQAVIVGSYAESRNFVYVNLKVIRPSNHTVLAVYDYALPMDSDNRRLLRR